MTTLQRLFYTLVLILGTLGASAQIFSESFDGTTFPPAGWSAVISSGSYNWVRVTSNGNPTASPRSGAGFTKFQSYDAASGSKALLSSPSFDLTARAGKPLSVTFWMYRDNSYVSNVDYVEVWVNTANSITGTGATKIGTVNRNQTLSPASGSTGWFQYSFTVPASYTGSTNYIIFHAVSGYGSNMYLDDIVLDYPPDRNIGVTAVTSPVGNTCGTINLDSLKVTVTNASIHKAWGYTVRANITGTIGVTPYSLTLSRTMPNTDTLQAGQSVNINLGSLGNTYNGGTLNISAYTSYAQDYTRANDTMKLSRTFSKRPFGATIVKGSPYKGLFKAGTSANPDIARSLDTMVYELQPPTGYTNAQFMANWAISSFTATTLKGTAIYSQDTLTMAAGASNFKFRYVPDRDFEDSTIRFTITLTDIQTGCSETYVRYAYVAPMPNFNISYSGTCLGQTTTFDNFSTIANGSAGYIWNYGDPNSNDANGFNHTYSAVGTYQVHVTGVNGYGFSRDTTFSVTITTPPTVSFTVTNACLGDSVSFAAIGSGSGTISYNWAFGDGKTASGQNVKHAYTLPGLYNGSLTITDGNACVVKKNVNASQFAIPVADFTAEGHCSHSDVTFNNISLGIGNMGYIWDFGNGDSSIEVNPKYAFIAPGSKDVKLTAVSGFGCINTVTKTVAIAEGPKASFVIGNQCDRENVQFNSTSILPGAGTNNFTWYFGDGDSISNTVANAPQHIYTGTGQREVTLVVRNSNGCTSSASQMVNIRVKPEAMINMLTSACSGNAVKFLNATNTMGAEASYMWDFGDSHTATDFSPSHTYNVTSSTTYQVTLYAQADGGCSDTVTMPITINKMPSCDFTVTSAMLGNRTFNFNVAGDAGSTYQWYFGDGTTSSSQNPAHQYTYDNEFDITLRVTSSAGCICESTQKASVIKMGTGNVNSKQLNAYPNPTQGHIIIDLAGLKNVESGAVYNMMGAEVATLNVAQAQSGQISADLSHLPDAVYMIRLVANNQVYVTRVNVAH